MNSKSALVQPITWPQNKRQCNIWTYHGLVNWRKYMSLDFRDSTYAANIHVHSYFRIFFVILHNVFSNIYLDLLKKHVSVI